MKLALHTLLFSSGAAGLVYEICWSRQLGLWLGHGERGASLTLALFFAGMAGGYAFAAHASRLTRPLRGYAASEAVIAVSALALPTLSAHFGFGSGLWLALLPPTFAMGASLPFAMQAVEDAGANLARAYTFHLLGATLGTLLATFSWIETFGVWGSTYVAAAVSAGCACLAYLLPTRETSPPNPSKQSGEGRRTYLLTPRRLITTGRGEVSLIAAGLAGAATLALQVLALRLFALTFHNSTYTFGLTAGVFIVCLAVGSRWASQSSPTRSQWAAGRGAWLAAFGTVLVVPLFSLVTRFGELRAPTFFTYLMLAAGLVLFVLAMAVVAAGSLLPALWSSAHSRGGHAVGSLSAVNSLGAACGALLASFVLLPKLGLFSSLACVAACYAALGVLLSGWTRRTLLTLAALVALGSITHSRGPESPAGYALLERWQSPYGWLDLLEQRSDHSLSARLDLHYQLGSSSDRARHLGMGELALLLHPKPKRALFIGLATGMTASAALGVPSVEQIEIVELIPEVERLARRFARHNAKLLEDPRVHVTLEDGRTYMTHARAAFDVIVSDLFVPWHSHAGYLYTVEHYRAVRARLSSEGVFAQWLPLWQLGAEELDLVGASLAEVFPHTSVWLNNADPSRALLAIVGHMRPEPAPRPLAFATWLGPFSRRPGALLNSDEHPRVEFLAPRSERDQRLLRGSTLQRYLALRFVHAPTAPTRP